MRMQNMEQIYLGSPAWLQNILVSLYGLSEHKRRYGGDFQILRNQLKQRQFISFDQITPVIDKKLNHILKSAVNEVPYYRDMNLSSPRLTNFPLLDRDTVSRNTDRLLNDNYKQEDLIKLYTGGSTGTPLEIYMTKKARQESYSYWALFYERMGVYIGEPKSSFVGRKIQRPNNNKPPFWRYNLKDKQLLFSSYHLTDNNIPDYIDKLNKFKPKIIEGYPQSIFRIADYIVNRNIALTFKPNGISTSSEHFTKEQRSIMEAAFKTKVYDQYGSAESVVFASECEFGTMHIEPEYGIVEVLTKSGGIQPEGSGELIVTTLFNDAMPLIRYRIGDLGKVINERCQCGRSTQVLKDFYGKVGAVLVSGDKHVPTAAIALAFKYSSGLRNAQIIQNDAGSILVKLSTNQGFSTDSEASLLSELRRMLGDEMFIETEYVQEIPPDKNGKYHLIIQNYLKSL